MSTQPSSNPKPKHWEDPADVQRRQTDYFLSLLSDPAVVEYVNACVRRGISVYDALVGYTEGVPIEYLLAVGGADA